MNAEAIPFLGPHLSKITGGGWEITAAKLYLKLVPSVRYKIYSMLARLLDAEIDARSALDFIYEVQSSDGKHPNELSAVAVRHWSQALLEHGALSRALDGWVPLPEVLLIEAGEKSGRFGEALGVMLRLNDKVASIRGQVIGKLAYPVLMTLGLAGTLVFLSNSFLPPLVAIHGADKPWFGQAARTVALLQWAKWGVPITLTVLVVAIGIIGATLGRFSGQVRILLDSWPPWNVHRVITGTGFLAAVLVLMESGHGMVDALDHTRLGAAPYLAAKLDKIRAAMREGHDFGTALLKTGDQFPDRELIKEIQIYDRVGKLDEGLYNIVDNWMTDVTVRVNRQIGICGQLIMVGSFSVLGFVFNGVYAITQQLSQN